jgi:F-type H+-transporting ATPase subunit b
VVLAANFLVPNGTFIVELVTFLVVFGLLARYVLPQLNATMEKRQAVIRQALTDAEAAKRRSEEAEAEYKRLIDEARAQARTLVDEANRLGEQLRSDKRSQADQEFERRVASAQAEIDSSARRAAEELRGQIAEMVIMVVERVIGEGFDDAAHRALIDRTIAEVEADAQAGAAEVSA